MKVVSLLPLALAASALVIPDAETVEALTREQPHRKPHPIWENIKDPARFWEEVEERFDQATKYTQRKLEEAVDGVHDAAVTYYDDYQAAFAAESWMNSANHHRHHGGSDRGDHGDDDDEGPPEDRPRHHRRPHHGPPEDGPPEDGPPEDGPPGDDDPEEPPRGPHHRRPHHGPPKDGPPEDGPPEDGPPGGDDPEEPPRGPHHRRPHHRGPHCPHHGPPDDDEPPHHGPPHHGPPGHGPPGRGPPHHGPPHEGPPHHGPPHEGPPHHCPCPPHHGFPHYPHIPHHFNKTIYEIITQNNFTTKLAKAINEYPDLIALLNATNATNTLFAPLDIAFDKIPEGAPKAPKEFLKKLLTYHISPELYDARRLLFSRTVPTALETPFIGNKSQRISTQLGPGGGYLNFYSHVIAANFFGTNGVIHAIDSLLFPPPKAIDIISVLPTFFSTFELGLVQTGLFDPFLNTSLHEGGTLFLPPNSAFAILGPLINGFLFSPFGLKYLQALLLYHVVPDITLYSDAIYRAGNSSASAEHIPVDFYHLDLPTGLANHSLSVNVFRFGRIVDIKINGFVHTIVQDGIVADGVVHVVPFVLIPPREEGGDAEYVAGEMTLEEFKARLEPYVKKDDADKKQYDHQQYIELELK